MTHTEIIKKLIGPISPTGCHETDIQRLTNTKAMCGVLLDLLEEVLDAARAVDRPEASMASIGKYASDTIGIINENTGAWDECEGLRKRISELKARLVVAAMKCPVCGQISPSGSYEPRATRYPDSQVV